MTVGGKTQYHTNTMGKAKVAVTVDQDHLKSIDLLVAGGRFQSRSALVQEAVAEKLRRIGRARLAVEAAKLDPQEEHALAEEGLHADSGAWPEY